MFYIADLHLHSHYSRATSKDLNLESLYQWARLKGINVVGTGDFTHPQWFEELQEKLEPDGNGFFTLKNPPKNPALPRLKTHDIDVRFCLTTEISSIYKYGDRVRKNHNLVYAPDFETVARLNQRLSTIGNLASDGRPILGLPSRDLLEIVLDTSDRAYLVPAHIWTPWFSSLGSKAGYDSIKECFRDLTDHLFAVETGLSSDPAMNWKISELDRFTLISNSDAHSPRKLGREANLFDTDLSYDGMFNAIKSRNGFLGTYEFYPEEGKYHHDGHRKCNVSLDPETTRKYNGICPVCGKPLTVGVLNRVDSLSDRTEPQQPSNAPGYDYIIPLPEILAEIEGSGPDSKKVRERFSQVISRFGNEFSLLREVPVEDIQKQGWIALAEAIHRLRNNEVEPLAGYDGVFGVIKIFKEGEVEQVRGQLGFFGPGDYQSESNEIEVEAANEPVVYNTETVGKSGETAASLNSEQDSVCRISDKPVLVVAGPGTGKTRTLTEWIARRVENWEADPSEVMAVTFTNKAADELRERLTTRIGKRARYITIGTFHAIAWQLIKEHMPELLSIYDATSRQMSLLTLFPNLNNSQIRTLGEHIEQHLESEAELQADDRDYFHHYREWLTKQHAVDLSGLMRHLIDGWKENSNWLQQVRRGYRAIAVDEFQDINPVQYEIIRLLGTDKHLLAIGDPDQSIYGFRGSDVTLFYRFRDEFRAEEIPLKKNYRSTKNIVKAASALIRHNATNSGVTPVAQRISDSKVTLFKAPNPFREADYILGEIERYVGGIESLSTGLHTDSQFSYGFGDIAVLFRTKAVGEAIFKAFEKAGIPATFGDSTSFLAAPPFSIVSDMLQLSTDPDNRLVLSDLLTEAYSWSESNIASLLAALNTEPIPLFGDDPLSFLDEFLRTDLEDLRTVYHAAQENRASDNLKNVVETICDHYLPDDKLDNADRFRKETLLELASGSSSDIQEFLEKMKLNPYTDAGRMKIDAVHLLTFHASKGLEFPVVFIAGAEEGITPLTRKDTDIEEERRLFYVAMTRAKDELQITCSSERSRYGQIETVEPSRFINEIPDNLRSDNEKQSIRKRTPKDDGKQLGLF